MADLDFIKYLKPLDLVTPVEAAMRLHESRENSKTQRMYAQSQMARQSAQDFRDERAYADKQEEKKHADALERAAAVEKMGQMLRMPGGAGPAQALADANGIALNPLQAAVAGPPPPQGDAVDQALAPALAAPGGASPPGPGPVEGPTPAPPGGVTSGGMAPVVAASREIPGAPIEGPVELGGDPLGNAPPQTIEGPQQLSHQPEGNFLLPTGMHVSPGLDEAMAHGGVPRGAVPLPGGGGGPSPAALEALMAQAAPGRPAAPPPSAAPTNPLYEAVLGGHHYQLSSEQPKTGLDPKYDAIAQRYMAMGASPKDAFSKAFGDQMADEKAKATDDRMMALLGAKNEHSDTHDATYGTTAEQKQKDFEIAQANANARAAAANRSRERTAGAGGGDVSSQIANHLATHPGDVEGATKIAEDHNIHGQKAAALVGGIATDLGKKPPTAGGIDKSKIVRDLDGAPLGGAPSGRGGAAAIQSDLRTNQEALDKLIKVRKSGQTLAMGPEYHDAILALAAVTTAGKTDLTTHHEEGAITNWTGKMLSSDGLDNKINQLKTRIQEIHSQLTPLPEGYTEERAGAAKGKKLSADELAGGSFLP